MGAALPDVLRASLPHVIDAAVRGAIVLLAALVLTTFMRRRAAAARHAVWVGAVAAQLLLLGLALWGPRWHVAAPDPVSALVPAALEEAPAPTIRRHDQTNVGSAQSAPSQPSTPTASSPAPRIDVEPTGQLAPPTPTSRVSGRTMLGVLWALGALAILARLVAGTTMIARLARRGDRIDDGGWLSLSQRLSRTLRIHRPLILMRGDRLGVPVTWGIIYPVVLLPDDADSWPDERRRFVLVHEMAHVKRLDALTQLVGQIALALFWFDPLLWIATRRMQMEREHACDDYVLRHGTQPSQYANDLLEMVRALGSPSHRGAQPAFAALAMARRSEFEGRMLSILDPVLDRHPLSRGRTLMSALVSLLVIVPLAALQPYRPVAQTSTSTSRPMSASASASTDTSSTDTSSTRQRVSAADSHVVASDKPLSQRLSALDSAQSALGTQLGANRATSASRETSSSSATGSISATSSTSASSATSKSAASSSSSTNRANSQDDDSCDAARFGGSRGTSSHVHVNDDPQSGSDVRYLDLEQDRCLEVRIRGKYRVSEKEDRVVSLTPGSRVYLRERTAADNREITYTPADANGASVTRSYRHNGADAPIDDAANQWIASILPTVLAELSIDVGPRVTRWRAEGGVDGALRHIAALHSSGAKRAHYEALLDEKRLEPADAQRIVAQAGHDVPSSGDLRAVLSKAAPQIRSVSGKTSALETAIAAVASSGDRTAVLELYGQTNDRELLLAVMRLASDIPSSGDKSNLLVSLAPRYFAKDDAALRETFFRAAATVPSSSDLARVLDVVIPFAAKSSDVALGVIATSAHIAASGDRSNVLVSLADAGAIRSTALRDAYLRAAQEIPASSDMRRVLEALTRH